MNFQLIPEFDGVGLIFISAWHAYFNKCWNVLFPYIYVGLEETAKEQIFKTPKIQQVVHKNTHLQSNLFSGQADKTSALAKSAAVKASMKLGRVGHDGKEILTSDSPQVKGYGFVGTPSPAPGIRNSLKPSYSQNPSSAIRFWGIKLYKGRAYKIIKGMI